MKKNIKIILKKFKAQELAAAAGLLIFIFINIFSFGERCAEIRSGVLRLHVIANSDAEADQEMKLAVRDALLETGADIFKNSLSAEEAAGKIAKQRGALESAARAAADAYERGYDVKIILTEEYFGTRSYENFTLPAGKYRAVKAIIGAGEGQNWWCVMFPPLCLPAAEGGEADMNAVFTGDELRLIESSPKYELRFKIVEIYEKIAARLLSGRAR